MRSRYINHHSLNGPRFWPILAQIAIAKGFHVIAIVFHKLLTLLTWWAFLGFLEKAGSGQWVITFGRAKDGKAMAEASDKRPVVVAVENLVVERGGIAITAPFSAKLEANDKVLLTGPSGSGKSTILKALMGFLPFKGAIHLFDSPLAPGNQHHFRSRMAYLSQQNALPSGTLNEFVAETCHFRINRQQGLTKAHVRQCFDHLQLPHKIWQQRTSALSGGEQQRVRLALSLALDRELYLLDEPTASLDADLRQVVVDWLSQKPETTILVAAHDQAWAAANWPTLALHA